MRRWLVRLGVAVAVAAAVLILRATLFAPKPVPVEVVEAAPGLVEETVANSRAGTVRARRRAKLSPEIGGQVAALPHREGDRAAAGEILLRLDDSSQRARLTLARREREAALARRRQACLTADRAARELARVERLAREQIVSSDLLDQVQSAEEAARAACQAARASADSAAAAVEVAASELAKTVLRAPFDGIVAELTTEVGEWVTPSPPALPVPPVVDFLDPSSLYVSAPMDEVDSARIRPGQPARVTVDSHRDRPFPGRVARVAPYVLDIQEQNRTVEIEVELMAGDLASELLPGTSADVEVILQARDDVLRLPTSALLERSQVLILEDGRLAIRQVETGLRNWDYTEIQEGLERGEQVVVSLDRPEVRPGARAVVAGDAAEP